MNRYILLMILSALKNRTSQRTQQPVNRQTAPQSGNNLLPLISKIPSAMKGGLPALGAVGFNFAAPPVVSGITNAVGRLMGNPTNNKPLLNPSQSIGYGVGTIANMLGSGGISSMFGGQGNSSGANAYNNLIDQENSIINNPNLSYLQKKMMLGPMPQIDTSSIPDDSRARSIGVGYAPGYGPLNTVNPIQNVLKNIRTTNI